MRKLLAIGRVTVALSGREVFLGWEAREALMARMRHVGGTDPLLDAFDAVGASRPVDVGPGQRDALLQVLEHWASGRDDCAAIPPELLELRDALIDDFDGTEQQG